MNHSIRSRFVVAAMALFVFGGGESFGQQRGTDRDTPRPLEQLEDQLELVVPSPPARPQRLGVQVDNLDVGVRVTRVVPDSPAARAGLEVEDIIVTYEGRQVGYVNGQLVDLGRLLSGHRGRRPVTLLVRDRRTGNLRNVSVRPEPITLEEVRKPVLVDPPPHYPRPRPEIGLTEKYAADVLNSFPPIERDLPAFSRLPIYADMKAQLETIRADASRVLLLLRQRRPDPRRQYEQAAAVKAATARFLELAAQLEDFADDRDYHEAEAKRLLQNARSINLSADYLLQAASR